MLQAFSCRVQIFDTQLASRGASLSKVVANFAIHKMASSSTPLLLFLMPVSVYFSSDCHTFPLLSIHSSAELSLHWQRHSLMQRGLGRFDLSFPTATPVSCSSSSYTCDRSCSSSSFVSRPLIIPSFWFFVFNCSWTLALLLCMIATKLITLL